MDDLRPTIATRDAAPPRVRTGRVAATWREPEVRTVGACGGRHADGVAALSSLAALIVGA
jgi:hypothetical protein